MPSNEHAAEDWGADRVRGLSLKETYRVYRDRRNLTNALVAEIAKELLPKRGVTMNREVTRDLASGKRTLNGKNGQTTISEVQLLAIVRALQADPADFGINLNAGDTFRLRNLLTASGFAPDPGDRRKELQEISFAERRAAHQGKSESRWFPVLADQAA